MNIIELLTILQALTTTVHIPPCRQGEHQHLPKNRSSLHNEEDFKWKMINEEVCGSSLEDRIIGGMNASLGQYPWIARIGYLSVEDPVAEPTFRCGGTLINQCYILTAAHCVTNLPLNLKVGAIRLGEYNTVTDIDCVEDECAAPIQDYKPKQIILHRNYDTPVTRNDIALVRLTSRVHYTKWIKPICLPYDTLIRKDFVGMYADVAGWGYYDLNKMTGSEVLLTVKLPVIPGRKCKKTFRRISYGDEDQLCVGGIIGQDSCNGDSGGPLMKVEALDGPPRYFQIGIVSFGAKLCGYTHAPAVYTRVSSFMPWILSTITNC